MYNLLSEIQEPGDYYIDRTDKSFILAKTIFSKDSDYEAIQDSLEFVGCDYGSTTDAFHMISRYKSFAMKGEVILCYEVFPQNELKILVQPHLFTEG